MKNFSKEKKNCHLVNLNLSKSDLQFQTFGNVSQRINEYLFKSISKKTKKFAKEYFTKINYEILTKFI